MSSLPPSQKPPQTQQSGSRATSSTASRPKLQLNPPTDAQKMTEAVLWQQEANKKAAARLAQRSVDVAPLEKLVGDKTNYVIKDSAHKHGRSDDEIIASIQKGWKDARLRPDGAYNLGPPSENVAFKLNQGKIEVFHAGPGEGVE